MSDQLLGSIIGGGIGATAAILIALAVVVRYLDRRDVRNQQSFQALSEVYAGVHRDLIQSFERTVERLISAGAGRGGGWGAGYRRRARRRSRDHDKGRLTR